MIINRLFFGWIILACLAALMGCQAVPVVTPGPDEDQFTTAVAATLDAGAAQASPVAPQDEESRVTETPFIETEVGPTEQPTLPASNSLVVAYTDLDRNLWVWREGSVPRQLTTSDDVENVQISSDGAWIAVTRTTDSLNYSLWAVRSDGGSETSLVTQAEFAALPRPPEAITVVPSAFAWVPGTHLLAFNTRPAFEGLGLMMNDDLWMVDADTGERRELLKSGEGGAFAFSPDGRQVAISTPDEISLINVDGSNRRDAVLSFPRVSTYSEYFFYPAPRWSADSAFLRVAIPPPAAMEDLDDPAHIWHIPADGSPASQVGSFLTLPLSSPVLSPDLTKVAFLRQVGDLSENRRELHISAADESEDQVYLTEAGLVFQSWAPDSERFAFTVGDNQRPYLGQAGTGPLPLTDTTGAMDVRWVDANRFLFISRGGGGVELRLGTVGETSQLVATVPGDLVTFMRFDFTRQGVSIP